MSIVGIIVGILIAAVISGIAIWIVGKLGLGLEVSGFGAAFIAGIVIAVIGGVLNWLLGALGIGIGGDLVGAVIHLIIAAAVLLVGGRIVPGLRVKGFTGAIIAALAIAVVVWLSSLIVGAIA